MSEEYSCKPSTDLFHVLWFRGRCIPAVIQDENIGPRQTLIHLVEELLLLDKGRLACQKPEHLPKAKEQ